MVQILWTHLTFRSRVIKLDWGQIHSLTGNINWQPWTMSVSLLELQICFISSICLYAIDCSPRCTARCSATAYKKPCMFFCQKCCAKCLCVPAGTYGNKQSCPCYNNWKTKRGGPKCPWSVFKIDWDSLGLVQVDSTWRANFLEEKLSWTLQF